MSTRDTHPALHDPDSDHARDPETYPAHFVPIGWEDLDRGLCPCGEAVRWDEAAQSWIADRSIVVVVLTSDEAIAIVDGDVRGGRELVAMLERTLALHAV